MRVIISAGGTGGHIYPAIAIINKIKEKEPNSEFLYIGTTNRMEKDLIPSLGIKYEGIEISGLTRSLTLKNFKVIKKFLNSISKCRKIIKDFNPDIVIGAGGYVTAPVIYAASKLHKKTFIHEQNSVVGLSNKFLSRYVSKVGVSFESTMKDFNQNKVVLTGNPCGENALKLPKKDKSEFGLSKDKKLILFVMGSLGSKTINDKILSFSQNFKDKDYEVLFVTGKDFYETAKRIKVPDNFKMVPFIENLPTLMKSTNLMITRAGASTMSEIMTLGVPSIFVPSPYVTNNHQYKNAMDLVNKEAGLILEEKDFNFENLDKLIEETLNNKKKYDNIKDNLQKLGIKDSSERIYKVLKELIQNDKKVS